MNRFSQFKVSKMLSVLAWLLAGAGTIVLLAAAVHKSNSRKCSGLSITIRGDGNKLFIDPAVIRRIIAANIHGNVTGRPISEFDLRSIEDALEKDIWIRDAQLYFDNNEKFRVVVTERKPVVRLFCTGGRSYYVDDSLTMLPLSDLFSARLPVFTGFPSDKSVLSAGDSALLKDVCGLSQKITGDEFLSAMIDQVFINEDREFELYPKMGNQTILFGDISGMDEKISNLKAFYKTVIPRAGWNKYSRITLKYQGQVLGKLRGKGEVRPDSLRTTELLQMIAEKAEKLSADSLPRYNSGNEKNQSDLTMIQSVISRTDDAESRSASKTALPGPKSGNSGAVNNSKTPNNKIRAAMPSKPNSQKKN